MSRKIARKSFGVSPCECLEKAFGQARMGAKIPITISCTSNSCPVREVEPRVVGDFLEFIGAMQDELLSKSVMPLRELDVTKLDFVTLLENSGATADGG